MALIGRDAAQSSSLRQALEPLERCMNEGVAASDRGPSSLHQKHPWTPSIGVSGALSGARFRPIDWAWSRQMCVRQRTGNWAISEVWLAFCPLGHL